MKICDPLHASRVLADAEVARAFRAFVDCCAGSSPTLVAVTETDSSMFSLDLTPSGAPQEVVLVTAVLHSGIGVWHALDRLDRAATDVRLIVGWASDEAVNVWRDRLGGLVVYDALEEHTAAHAATAAAV